MIAGAGAQETAELFPALVLRCGLLGGLEALRPPLGRDGCGEIGELLRLQREKLVAGLRCLQRRRSPTGST